MNFQAMVLQSYILVTLIELLVFVYSFNFNFNREYVGVEFFPYLQSSGDAEDESSRSKFTFEDLKTMMRVISSRFSKVLIMSVDAESVPYVKNDTYYNHCGLRARTAEAAALINRERNSKVLTIIVGIYNCDDWKETLRWNSEVQVALEAVQIANSIYPGTVDGIMLVWAPGQTFEWANFTMSWITRLRSMTSNLGVRVGSLEVLDDESTRNFDIEQRDLVTVLRKVVPESDFLIFHGVPGTHFAMTGLDYAVQMLRNNLRPTQNLIKTLNKDIEVMAFTHWPCTENDTWYSDYFKYWANVNQLASEFNLTFWLRGAFDTENSSTGWWKLKRYDLANNVSGYTEKIQDLPLNNRTEFNKILQGKKENEQIQTSGLAVPLSMGFAGFVCVAIIVFVAIRRYRSLSSKRLTAREIKAFKFGDKDTKEIYKASKELARVRVPALKIPYDTSFEIPRERLDIFSDEVLGGGEFGLVCKGIIKGEINEEVAVKMPRRDCLKIGLTGLLSEIKVLQYLGEHPNLVGIRGAYTAQIGEGIAYLALELCELGSLKDYLRNLSPNMDESSISGDSDTVSCAESLPPNEIPLNDMIRWLHEIACGMQHLENKNVIHADLATRNVVLTANGTAKITDFGLSRRLYEYSNYKKRSQDLLPWRWMALESLKNAEFSVKSDAWSYGTTAWEIFSLGSLPFPGFSWNTDFMDALEHGLKLQQPHRHSAPDEIYRMMRKCWHLVPEKRPNFQELCAKTMQILNKRMVDDLPAVYEYPVSS